VKKGLLGLCCGMLFCCLNGIASQNPCSVEPPSGSDGSIIFRAVHPSGTKGIPVLARNAGKNRVKRLSRWRRRSQYCEGYARQRYSTERKCCGMLDAILERATVCRSVSV
jgi:hypothetical protein